MIFFPKSLYESNSRIELFESFCGGGVFKKKKKKKQPSVGLNIKEQKGAVVYSLDLAKEAYSAGRAAVLCALL